eukprot:symbB.v1.2.015823.t1/scaffold1191.1/size132917/2
MAVPLSKSELDFALQALRVENVRVDGRPLTAYRRLGIRFGATHGEVNFGPSRAFAVCSGEIIAPAANRPKEGRISFHVEFGPLASPNFEVGRPSPQAISVGNFVERLLRGSRAIDAEALCIVGGQKVWSIRVDVRAMDDDGNLSDVCAIAALCSLLHFRKADVEVKGDSAQAFTVEERAPVPLSVHHLPVPVTFALFPGAGKETEPAWVLDPNRLEEAAMSGSLCIAVNQHGELCGVHKPGGLPVDFAMLEHCMDLAKNKAKEITSRINAELEADLAKRQQAKKNVHQQFTQEALLTVDLLGEVDVVPTPPVLVSEPAEGELLVSQAKPSSAPVPPPVEAPEVSQESPKRNRWKRPRSAEVAESPKATPTPQVAKAAAATASPGNDLKATPTPQVAKAAAATASPRNDLKEASSMENLEAEMEDDGRDLDAELQAVALEAAELEAQLEAAAACELAALEETGVMAAEGVISSEAPEAPKKKRKKKIIRHGVI